MQLHSLTAIFRLFYNQSENFGGVEGLLYTFFNHVLSHDDFVTRPCDIVTIIISYGGH